MWRSGAQLAAVNCMRFWWRLRSLFGATLAGLGWARSSQGIAYVSIPPGPWWRRLWHTFKLAPPPVAFDAPPPPPFSGPPDSELGATVPLRKVLASNHATVIALTDCAAYSNGFEFLLTVRSRDDIDHRLLGFGPPRPPGAKEPDSLFRITVRFADGRSASSDQRGPGVEVMDYYSAKRDGLEPKLPIGPLLLPRSGGGGGKRWDFKYWVWPLPPEGNLTLMCEWPARGISLTEHELDGAAIRRAGESSTELWTDR